LESSLQKGEAVVPLLEDLSFAIDVIPERSRVVVHVRGELDAGTVGRLDATLADLRGAGWTDIVLDVARMSFVDSQGLRLLVATNQSARREQWRFAIAGECPPFARLLELSHRSAEFERA
jgi:anti-sigma B factor antagonist